MRVVQNDLWLCTDCTVLAVNGDGVDDEQAHDACVAGLERLGVHLVPDWDPETDVGHREHSRCQCDCCRSRPHGERYRFAVLGA